jgi:signal transduction histidine kinase
MKATFFFLILIFWLTCSKVFASSLYDLGQPYFETVDDRQNAIMAMTQDSAGFIWVGSQDGISRFDGYTYKDYAFEANNPKSLSGNYINTLFSAKNGDVWAGTEGDGLSIYNSKTDDFRRIRKENNTGLSDDIIYSIASSAKDFMFIGTKSGLDLINVATLKVTNLAIPQCNVGNGSSSIHVIHFDKDNQLWVGGSHGLCKINNIESLDFSQPIAGELVTPFDNKNVTAILSTAHGKVFVGTRFDGGFIYDTSNYKVTPILFRDKKTMSNNNEVKITSFIQPSKNEVWMGLDGLGVLVLDAETGKTIEHFQHDPMLKHSINFDYISALLVDTSGLIWIGTWGNGLNRFNPNNHYIRTVAHSPYKKGSLSHSDVNAIMMYKDTELWIGTGEAGVDFLNIDNGVVGGLRSYEVNGVLPDKLIMAMVKESESSVWIGTRNGGLVNYNPISSSIKRFNRKNGLIDDVARSLHISEQKTLWIGTDSGVHSIDLDSGKLQSIAHYKNFNWLVGKKIYAIEQLSPNELWLGTSDGLFLLSISKQSIINISQHQRNEHLKTDNLIHSLLVDKHQSLWVGSDRGILRLINWDGKEAIFESINKKLGLDAKDIGANLLADENDRIWSYTGMIDTNSWRYFPMGKSQGWGKGTFWYGSYASIGQGLLAYGGIEGLRIVKPSLWKEWSYQPFIVLNYMAIDNKEVPSAVKRIDLPSESKSLSFEFTALDFSAPLQNKYAYKLLGYDDEWIEVTALNRRITYTNLPPKNYTLSIKGTNSSGMWSPHQLSVSIIKFPKWYQTYGFKLAFFILIFGLFFSFYKYRVSVLNKQKDILNKEVASRTDSINKLAEIGQDIASSLDLNFVLQAIYGHVNQLMPAQEFSIDLLNKDTNELTGRFAVDEKGLMDPDYSYSLTENNRPGVWCINNKKAFFINKLSEFKQYSLTIPEPILGKMSESIIYIPLLIEDVVIGCFSVQNYEQNAFNKHDLQVLKTIASYAAIALSNANSHHQLKEAQSQLVLAEKMAGLGTMTAGVAHEINNPTNFAHAAVYMMNTEINEIKAFLKQLAGGDNAEPEVLQSFDDKFTKLVELTKTATEGTTRIKTIVEDLRTFARLDGAKQAQIQVSDLINSTVHLVRTQYNSISIETQLDYEPLIKCFPSKLNQVFMNIIVNACQAIESKKTSAENFEGKVLIKINQHGDRLIITFEDNGCGMSEQTVNRVFEPFYTTKGVGTGTGLGMAISFGIIEDHNGTLNVDSVLNEGSIISIFLPVSNGNK